MKNFIALRLKQNDMSEKFYQLVKDSGLPASKVLRCALSDFLDGKFEKRKRVMDSVKNMKKQYGRPEWIYV